MDDQIHYKQCNTFRMSINGWCLLSVRLIEIGMNANQFAAAIVVVLAITTASIEDVIIIYF